MSSYKLADFNMRPDLKMQNFCDTDDLSNLSKELN